MPLNGIKAIFFDLDGTLRHNIPGGGEIFSEHVRSLGLEVSEDDFHRAMRWEFMYWASSSDLLDDTKNTRMKAKNSGRTIVIAASLH